MRSRLGHFEIASLPLSSHHHFRLSVDADTPDVPIEIFTGHRDGPKLALVAGVHGNEADGIAAIYGLVDQLETASFRGRLLLIPIANPAAFIASSRRHPADDVDLNRTFPGRVDGSPCERLAARLADAILRNCDFLFTLHGWHSWGMTTPHVEYDAEPGPTQAASRAACLASGFALTVATDWPAGMLPKCAVNAGIPAIEAEVGGQGATTMGNRAFIRERINALMAHLGMTGHSSTAIDTLGCHWRHETIVASRQAVFRAEVEVGQKVVRGEHLGILHDLHGRERQALVAPAAGLVLTLRTSLYSTSGDPLVTLLVPT
jgi:predicted deacylase